MWCKEQAKKLQKTLNSGQGFTQKHHKQINNPSKVCPSIHRTLKTETPQEHTVIVQTMTCNDVFLLCLNTMLLRKTVLHKLPWCSVILACIYERGKKKTQKKPSNNQTFRMTWKQNYIKNSQASNASTFNRLLITYQTTATFLILLLPLW